jgi:hypothetical protein
MKKIMDLSGFSQICCKIKIKIGPSLPFKVSLTVVFCAINCAMPDPYSQVIAELEKESELEML